MPISIENNSWDYVQGLIEKEINLAFKLRIKENKKEEYDLAILSRLDKGVEKTKEKGSLEDINLSLIGGVRVEAFT